MSSGIITPSYSYLLDTYSGASVAYSLRKLSSTYSGNCIRVRRSSDNTEQDFGFVSNALDTASLSSFVGAGNGFVTTWYDQSGNSKNAIQTTASNQPQIFSSGNIILSNSKPTIQFDGSDDHLLNGVGSVIPSNVSSFIVRSFSSYPTSFRTVYNYKTYGLTHYLGGGVAYGDVHLFSNNTVEISTDYPKTTGQALDFTYNKLNLERNNFTATLSPGSGYGAGVSAIGSWNGTSQCFLGSIQELIIYESNKNTDKSNIKTNINTHYAIY